MNLNKLLLGGAVILAVCCLCKEDKPKPKKNYCDDCYYKRYIKC